MQRRILKIAGALCMLLVLNSGCARAQKQPGIVISTDFGDIRLTLYDDTPLHRDNFMKLSREGYFDGVLFHRVIKHFMIQGGDPESKSAQSGARLGNGGPGYTVPAEFIPGRFHKKGALAAARTGDQTNPLKASSGSQFYIVVGKVWRPGELDTLETQMNATLRQNVMKSVFTPAQQELSKYKQENNQEAFNKRVVRLQAIADSLFQLTPKVTFSEAQRQAYTTLGGTPHLDGGYTVFGEVTAGLDVIDKIAAVETDKSNRPLRDVKMKIRVID